MAQILSGWGRGLVVDATLFLVGILLPWSSLALLCSSILFTHLLEECRDGARWASLYIPQGRSHLSPVTASGKGLLLSYCQYTWASDSTWGKPFQVILMAMQSHSGDDPSSTQDSVHVSLYTVSPNQCLEGAQKETSVIVIEWGWYDPFYWP